jgi:hypothetical protein
MKTLDLFLHLQRVVLEGNGEMEVKLYNEETGEFAYVHDVVGPFTVHDLEEEVHLSILSTPRIK